MCACAYLVSMCVLGSKDVFVCGSGVCGFWGSGECDFSWSPSSTSGAGTSVDHPLYRESPKHVRLLYDTKSFKKPKNQTLKFEFSFSWKCCT